MKQRPMFKPVNFYGSKWFQRIEDLSDRLEMVLSMMRNDHPLKDAQELIFQELAQLAHTTT